MLINALKTSTYLGFADVCVEDDHCLFLRLKQDLTGSLFKMNCEVSKHYYLFIYLFAVTQVINIDYVTAAKLFQNYQRLCSKTQGQQQQKVQNTHLTKHSTEWANTNMLHVCIQNSNKIKICVSQSPFENTT